MTLEEQEDSGSITEEKTDDSKSHKPVTKLDEAKKSRIPYQISCGSDNEDTEIQSISRRDESLKNLVLDLAGDQA